VFAGLALWFGSIVVQTGVDTFVALWKVALLMGGLLLVTIPTRTVTVIELLAPFSLGSAMVGVALLAGRGLDLLLGAGNSRGRALGMPLVEESLKIAPVLWILWRQRRRRARTFGVSDVLLLAAASGAGFNWVEEAFILHSQHSSSFLGEFPTTEIVGSSHGSHLIAGHAIWTAIAGLMIGIAMALRGPLVQRLLIGVSGWVWAVMDHAGPAIFHNSARRNASQPSLLPDMLSAFSFAGGVGCKPRTGAETPKKRGDFCQICSSQ
jgi:RsiW-degrading membrane proteinase PrsW (M82 family)